MPEKFYLWVKQMDKADENNSHTGTKLQKVSNEKSSANVWEEMQLC
jgi:hypothetical protein